MAFDEKLLSLYLIHLQITNSFIQLDTVIQSCRNRMTPTDDDTSLLLRDIQDSLEDIKYEGHLENLENIVEVATRIVSGGI